MIKPRFVARAGILLALLVLAVVPGMVAQADGYFPVGTDPEMVDLTDAPGALPYDEGYAIPLIGAQPAWYTAELAEQVHASPGTPVAAPNDAPLPSEVGIRPGAWMVSPAGCTMNYVFQKTRGKRTDWAIGTAGHCVGGNGDPVVLLTLAPGNGNPVLVEIGKVIAHRDNGIGDDFALVEIYPELYDWVSPTMAVLGGPCGEYYGDGPETIWHYGHGLGIGTGGTPRSGVALVWQQDAYGWSGAAIFGDSGSPARITDLKAAGNLTHLVVNSKWLPNYIAGTRIGKMLKIAKGWELADSPLCL